MFKFIFILLLPSVLYAQDIKSILCQLSKHDKQELTELFHTLMDDDQYCYTLFGDKPVSLSGDYVVTPYEVTLSGRLPGGIFWKKWDTWKKNQKKFPIIQYLFIE